MSVIKEELVMPCLSKWKFSSCEVPTELNKEGKCFIPPKELGEGYYWYYEKKDTFAISIIDLKLKEDRIMEYNQPEFISISHYDTISAEEINPYKRLNANYIRGHVADKGLFRARYHNSVPIRGMELMLMPKYYNDYLSIVYPGEFIDSKEAFRSIDGISEFPELVLLLSQIRAFKGSGGSAHLYFESKVTEAVSLIIEKTKKQTGYIPSNLSKDDMKCLDAVKSYISDHFAFKINAEQLSKIACMGQTKMRYSFKNLYGYTITEFIQNKRIAHAEYMLLKTDFPINQVAEAVGYNHAGRFSSLFKKSTGLLPEEYRKMIKV